MKTEKKLLISFMKVLLLIKKHLIEPLLKGCFDYLTMEKPEQKSLIISIMYC